MSKEKDKRTTNHQITFTERELNYLKMYPTASIEIRGARLAKDSFKNTWPNFCRFSISPGQFKETFGLPEREQSRKRKDFPINILPYLSLKKNHKFCLTLEYLPNATTQERNNDIYSYAIGVYLVFPLSVNNICDYFIKFECERVADSIRRINDQLTMYSSDDIISDELKFQLV